MVLLLGMLKAFEIIYLIAVIQGRGVSTVLPNVFAVVALKWNMEPMLLEEL